MVANGVVQRSGEKPAPQAPVEKPEEGKKNGNVRDSRKIRATISERSKRNV